MLVSSEKWEVLLKHRDEAAEITSSCGNKVHGENLHILYFSSVEATVLKHDVITILSSKSAEYLIQALGISGRYIKLE